jgi:hypothetical protein
MLIVPYLLEIKSTAVMHMPEDKFFDALKILFEFKKHCL